jgi:hypothetical protein
MEKMIAARTRIWPANGDYMGLNLGVSLQTGGYMGTDFLDGQSDGFTGVFFMGAPGENAYDISAYVYR